MPHQLLSPLGIGGSNRWRAEQNGKCARLDVSRWAFSNPACTNNLLCDLGQHLTSPGIRSLTWKAEIVIHAFLAQRARGQIK